MEIVVAKRNRGQKFIRTAPSMKNFLRIMRKMEMVPSLESNETFYDEGKDHRLWQLVT